MRINAIFCCCALFGVQINSMFYAYFGTVAVRLNDASCSLERCVAETIPLASPGVAGALRGCNSLELVAHQVRVPWARLSRVLLVHTRGRIPADNW